MRAKIGTLFSIALPLLTGCQERPWFIGFIPESVRTEGIVRERDDFRFVFVDPSQTLVKRHFVLLPIAVGDVDRQPIRATFSKRLACREFEQ
jgi:hypothetical protein